MKFNPSYLYIFGAFLGDGGIGKTKSGNYNLTLQVKSKGFAYSVNKALAYNGFNVKTYKLKCRDRYTTNVSNKWLFNIVKGLKNDCSNILLYLNGEISRREFIRGFFEAEGTACYRNQRGYQYPFVALYNNNFALITLVKSIIEGLGFRAGYSQSKGGNYQLYILGGIKERFRFINYIKPVIKNFHDETPNKPCEPIERVEVRKLKIGEL